MAFSRRPSWTISDPQSPWAKPIVNSQHAALCNGRRTVHRRVAPTACDKTIKRGHHLTGNSHNSICQPPEGIPSLGLQNQTEPGKYLFNSMHSSLLKKLRIFSGWFTPRPSTHVCPYLFFGPIATRKWLRHTKTFIWEQWSDARLCNTLPSMLFSREVLCRVPSHRSKCGPFVLHLG